MFINGKHLKLYEEMVHVFSEFDSSECDNQFKNGNHLKMHEEKAHVRYEVDCSFGVNCSECDKQVENINQL